MLSFNVNYLYCCNKAYTAKSKSVYALAEIEYLKIHFECIETLVNNKTSSTELNSEKDNISLNFLLLIYLVFCCVPLIHFNFHRNTFYYVWYTHTTKVLNKFLYNIFVFFKFFVIFNYLYLIYTNFLKKESCVFFFKLPLILLNYLNIRGNRELLNLKNVMSFFNFKIKKLC